MFKAIIEREKLRAVRKVMKDVGFDIDGKSDDEIRVILRKAREAAEIVAGNKEIISEMSKLLAQLYTMVRK